MEKRKNDATAEHSGRTRAQKRARAEDERRAEDEALTRRGGSRERRGEEPAGPSGRSNGAPGQPLRHPPPVSPPLRPDDQDGHLQYDLGDSIDHTRYKILAKLGEGTFGRVLECWDRELQEYVAIKVIRNVKKYYQAAMIEIEVLQELKKGDPERRWHCVQLRRHFEFRGHVCMVFDKLGLSLYDFLRRNHYRPFSLHLVREFGRQLLEAVAFLHDRQLVHTDLKPENILLVNSNYEKEPVAPGSRHTTRVPHSSAIRLIDFGSATWETQYHSSVVSTRHYRAPEVILGLPWSYPCDSWSVGCILIELLTGDALFQTHENLEHLAMMDTVLGHVPSSMVARADRHSQTHYFRATRDNAWALHWPEGSSSRDSLRAVRKLRPLRELVAAQASGPGGAAFADLMEGLLRYEPAARTTPRNALRHPFFTGAGWPAPPPPLPPPPPPDARRASGGRASGGTQRTF